MLATRVISKNVNNIQTTELHNLYMFSTVLQRNVSQHSLLSVSDNLMIIRNDRYLTQENHWTLLNHLLFDNK